jgi:release factor glutamine methyltransferase
MGYLNFQIEHHLFPSMPQYKNAAARLLKSGGVLAIEHTEEQGAAIDALLSRDFIDIAVHQDLTGRPRWSSAVRK